MDGTTVTVTIVWEGDDCAIGLITAKPVNWLKEWIEFRVNYFIRFSSTFLSLYILQTSWRFNTNWLNEDKQTNSGELIDVVLWSE